MVTKLAKTRLYEVDLMRLLVIVLLVAYHAFAPNMKSWPEVYPGSEIKTYWWLAHGYYAILLETFVFISGYLFGNQVNKKWGGYAVDSSKV